MYAYYQQMAIREAASAALAGSCTTPTRNDSSVARLRKLLRRLCGGLQAGHMNCAHGRRSTCHGRGEGIFPSYIAPAGRLSLPQDGKCDGGQVPQRGYPRPNLPVLLLHAACRDPGRVAYVPTVHRRQPLSALALAASVLRNGREPRSQGLNGDSRLAFWRNRQGPVCLGFEKKSPFIEFVQDKASRYHPRWW